MENSIVQDFHGQSLRQVRFGGYQILEHLGKGGMGDVYKAVQLGLERVVALKVLPSILARNDRFSERFYSEAFAISRLQHHNIVTIYDYGEEAYQKYIAMQYVQGPTLGQLIRTEQSLDWPRVINIAKQIGRGLKYAHDNEVVHRDIKSGNVMIERGDRVYISDFGIAKVMDSPGITTTGMTMGTPEYMAPEQCQGGLVDSQSDIYGLGIIVFEMVAGQPPFLAESPLAVAFKQVHESPPLLGRVRRDVPRRLELVVAKCLKKDKAERYRNAEELLRDLDSVDPGLATGPIDASPAQPPEKRITDRREGDRRHGMPSGRRRLFRRSRTGLLIPGLSALALLALVYAFTRTPRSGLSLMRPHSAEGLPFQAPDGRRLAPALAVDGDPGTFWAAGPELTGRDGAGDGRAVLKLRVPEGRLVLGLVLRLGSTQTAVYRAPAAVTVSLPDRSPLRFRLRNGPEPQYVDLGGSTDAEMLLAFEAAPGEGPVAVREISLAALPLD